MKALEKDRNRRYESASAFASDINRYLNDEPVEAGAPSTLYRLRKLGRRRRQLVGTVAVILTSLVLITGVSVAAAWRLSDKSQELAGLNQQLVEQRNDLEQILFGVVAQNRLSDDLHPPGIAQDYRSRAQFAIEALDRRPDSPVLHFVGALALDGSQRDAEQDPQLSVEERSKLRDEYAGQLTSVLLSWQELQNDEPGVTNALAFRLLTAARKLQDAPTALRLAKELQRRFPKHAPYLNTLALAYYRTG